MSSSPTRSPNPLVFEIGDLVEVFWWGKHCLGIVSGLVDSTRNVTRQYQVSVAYAGTIKHRWEWMDAMRLISPRGEN